MKPRLENLCYLALGLVLFYALNQHLVGSGAAYTCHAIVAKRNNFVAEIGMMACVSLIIYGGYIAWKNAPILSVSIAAVLVFGLLYLQNDLQGKSFNFAEAKVEKVWGVK